MTKQFLITRPNYNPETAYIYSFSNAIVAMAKQDKSMHITEIKSPDATRKNFESQLVKTNPGLVFLNGHGDKRTILGHDDEPILDVKNIDLVKEKIVYALACESLAQLGKIAAQIGVKAYIGYEKEFRWVVDPSRTSTPDKDKNAAPFRRVCHVLGSSLLSGEPAGKSIERAKEEYKKLIRNYGTSEDNFGDAPLIGLALSWDFLFLGMEGDASAAF